MPLNDEQCMARRAVIDLNHVKFNYHSFIISLDGCDGSCNNAIDDLSVKVCVPRKTKCINVEVFNMKTRINEAKIFLNTDSIVRYPIQIKNGIMKYVM